MFERTDLKLYLYYGSRAYFATAAAFEQNVEGKDSQRITETFHTFEMNR